MGRGGMSPLAATDEVDQVVRRAEFCQKHPDFQVFSYNGWHLAVFPGPDGTSVVLRNAFLARLLDCLEAYCADAALGLPSKPLAAMSSALIPLGQAWAPVARRFPAPRRPHPSGG